MFSSNLLLIGFLLISLCCLYLLYSNFVKVREIDDIKHKFDDLKKIFFNQQQHNDETYNKMLSMIKSSDSITPITAQKLTVDNVQEHNTQAQTNSPSVLTKMFMDLSDNAKSQTVIVSKLEKQVTDNNNNIILEKSKKSSSNSKLILKLQNELINGKPAPETFPVDKLINTIKSKYNCVFSIGDASLSFYISCTLRSKTHLD